MACPSAFCCPVGRFSVLPPIGEISIHVAKETLSAANVTNDIARSQQQPQNSSTVSSSAGTRRSKRYLPQRTRQRTAPEQGLQSLHSIARRPWINRDLRSASYLLHPRASRSASHLMPRVHHHGHSAGFVERASSRARKVERALHPRLPASIHRHRIVLSRPHPAI